MIKAIYIQLILSISLMCFSNAWAQNTKPVKSIPEAGKTITLTFDDGVVPEIHKQLLDILKEESVPVTFFMIGNKTKHKRLIKQTLKDGHEIGNHSMTHAVLPKETNEVIDYEILEFQNIFKKKYHYEPKVFRAPKLQYDNRIMRLLDESKLTPVNATVGTRDFADETTREYIYTTATSSPKLGPGSIILLHEVQKTVDVLPRIIAYYKQKGYKFLTVSQLLSCKTDTRRIHN